jgi:N-acetylglucosaminyl-diphospho-decaprenol L-rhamnosyltransferase
MDKAMSNDDGSTIVETVELSIIVINWNSCAFLRNCLDSIMRNPPSFRFEVIVIDNASFDGSAEMVHSEFPHVRHIQSKENLGFARGNNAAVLSANGRDLLFLNPDTKVLGNALSLMKECLDSVPDAGIVGCHILNYDGSIQTSAVQAFPTLLNQTLDTDLLRKWFPRSRLWGTTALFENGNRPVIVDTVSGACLMIRRSLFDRIGGFSTNYFMYSEDIDICHKSFLADSKTYYLSTASIVHFDGQSTKKKPSYFANVMQQQSRFLYFSKMRGNFYAQCFRVSRLAIALLRMALISILLLLVPAKRSQLRFSLGKWFSIFKWALGVEGSVPTKPKVSGALLSS